MYKIESNQILNTHTGCLVAQAPDSPEYQEFLLWYAENHHVLNNANVVEQQETRQAQTARLRAQLCEHLDSMAKQYGYDSILEACSYADEPAVPKYQLEGTELRAWRSLAWYWFEQHSEQAPLGTSWQQFCANMPQLVIPQTGVVTAQFTRR